jgi:hypothetical protein
MQYLVTPWCAVAPDQQTVGKYKAPPEGFASCHGEAAAISANVQQ